MGWNSWNTFGCNINEKLIHEVVDALSSSKMGGAGYQYVNIDDCWQGKRDAQGKVQPDPVRFPSGFKALGEYIHAKGFKFGVYSSPGDKTCAGYTGSKGYETLDAQTYADWKVDFLKYDWCDPTGLSVVPTYQTMRDALNATGRPIVLSLGDWGRSQPWRWAGYVGSQMWRTTGDIYNCFDCFDWSFKVLSVLDILNIQKALRNYSAPGGWNDMDMLEVGNGMTESQDRAHFSMWSLLAAPLIAGHDPRTMSEATRAILTNPEVIAVDQDALGIAGFFYSAQNDLEIWFKPLEEGGWAVAFLNKGRSPISLEFDWKTQPVEDSFNGKKTNFDKTTYVLRNLWTRADLGTTASSLKATVGLQDVLMLRLFKL